MTTDRTTLRAFAAALPPGHPITLPREWLLDLLDGAAVPSSTLPDLTVVEVAERYGRKPATVRGWICTGQLRAYKFQGRELRVPPDALEAFEAAQRPGKGGRITQIRPNRPVDLAEYRTAS
jgi:excisionase family DNA binding protein